MLPRVFYRNITILGERVPVPTALLIALVLAASILGAVGQKGGIPVVQLGMLAPDLVWAGQAWRLLTWVFFAVDPLSLLFGCWALWWVSTGLARFWSPGRFLGICLGIVALSAGLTCLVALLWPTLMRATIVGMWPLIDALIIAFGCLSPYTTVQMFFVFPVQGRSLIYFIVGMTVIYALFESIPAFVPHFLAEGLMLLYFRNLGLRRLWLKLRLSGLERSVRRRTSPLREVGRTEGDRPRWFH